MIKNLQEIKQSIKEINPKDILQLINYAKSKPKTQSGEIRDYCPIHEGDKQRSLSISKEGAFCCHSCLAKGGDTIELYRLAKKCDFLTAIQDLAEGFGIRIERENPEEKERVLHSQLLSKKKWGQFRSTGEHPYFESKGIDPIPGVKYGKGNNPPLLVIPYYDIDGVLQGIQYINTNTPPYPNKLTAPGTTLSKAFFSLGSINNGSRIVYLCEGVATASSVWMSESKGITTLSCASSSNLPKVAQEVRRKYPHIHIVLCLDDDKAGDDVAKKIQELS